MTDGKYSLWDHTSNYLERNKISYPRGGNLYPSEASVEFTNEWGEKQIEGGCLRKSFYRLTGTDGGEVDARAERIFALGRGVESVLVNWWKEMGVWVDNSVSFVSHDFGIPLKGEIDVILKEPVTNLLYGVEVKSYYGYYAGKEILGNRSQQGKPKASQLLQTLVYTYLTRPGGGWEPNLNHFRMVYMERGDGNGCDFKIELQPSGDDFIPMIDGELTTEFTFNNVKERYLRLKDYVDRNELPPRDFSREYSNQQIEKMISENRVPKTKKEAFEKKGEKWGDWQCGYCQMRDVCYSNSK